MCRQPRLVLLLLLSIGVFQVTVTTNTTPDTYNLIHDDITDNQLDLDSSEKTLTDQHQISKGIKISTPKVKNVPSVVSTTSTAEKIAAEETSTHKPVSEEILNDLIEASKHNLALADDPRFNKMLPDKFKQENETTAKKIEDHDDYYEYNYDYDDDYNYDETNTNEPKEKTKSSKLSKSSTTAKPEKKMQMKPIKEDDKQTSKSADIKHNNELLDDNHINNAENLDDNDDYDESDEDDDDDEDKEEIVFNENVPCPRYCVCARNINSYLVATCSRFDPETQKFGSDITDLIVTDVGPKYPILLGPEFFLKMGLKHVSSIKIANCTVEYLHPDAFHGLDELYSVNLTNVGLAIINPDTFANNKKLRMLTISGNDLSVMSSVHYLLKSSSLEELDLSRNNLMELNPNAFSQLTNIVYINLSQNNLQKIPENVFDNILTIEELDLSYNSLKTLPAGLFNRTELAILHLQYNSITGDLHFGTSGLQQLDLSFNSIHQVHHGMFDNMTGLTNLILKGNGIIKIQADSFLTLKSLRHIDLSINELDQISSMTFYKNSELDVIRLNDNPRLSQLPTDGFLSYNGYFTVYFLDISNCAIGALGHKTFSTMPHLATLKLSWNNINNLERDTFSSLTKLIDLDLSNNLIKKLDDLIFMNNNDLTKLNLAGNPIHKLSVRLFLPMAKLRELDVSECELTSLLTDNQHGVGRKYKFYETLRSFNASSNQIKKISSADVKFFKNLRTLDITHNPLKCNEEFQDFIGYVSLNTNTVPHKMPSLANLEDTVTFIEFQPQAAWGQLAHEVCKHHDSILPKTKDNKLENRIEQADKNLDEDAKNLLNIMESNKLNKNENVIKDTRKSEVVIDDPLVDSMEEDIINEDDLNNAGEVKDDDEEENESDYDDEDDEEDTVDNNKNDGKNDEDDYDSFDKKNAESVDLPKLKDHGIKVEEVELSKETQNQDILKKFIINGNDNTDNNVEEEIIIERGHIYYGGYDFLIPAIIVITCIVIMILSLVKIVAIVLHKRGERDRMALLASKNSIVYQKLSEEIKPTEKLTKLQKGLRYAQINQV